MKERRRSRRRRRRQEELLVLLVLVSSLVGLLFAYQHLRQVEIASSQEQLLKTAAYQVGDQVRLAGTDRPYVGQVLAVSLDSQDKPIYQVQLSASQTKDKVAERDLSPVTTKYSLGQTIEIFQSASIPGRGVITSVLQGESGVSYEADFEQVGAVTDIAETEISGIYQIPLKESNTASQNQEILRQAFDKARQESQLVLAFPSGIFKLGAEDPTKDYQLLPSNTKLEGNNTTLKIEGSALWFGLATGPAATDGVSNFTMEGLTIEAADLTKGAWFMIMTNHGNNWTIRNNSFNLVHKQDSHIFDLGGLQNSLFEGNVFRGYAPELVEARSVTDGNYHAFYSEAIQFDASDGSVGWDGGMIAAIDPNYQVNSQIKHLTANITVTGNSFLPYVNEAGKVIAYGATIGQHSSDVGVITVTNNTLENTITNRLLDKEGLFVLDPIHFPPGSPVVVENNTLQ